MAFWDVPLGAAASTFLVIFVLMFIASTYQIIKFVGWKTRYTAIWVYTVLRIGAQICAIGFSASTSNIVNWLIGYLVLGAEGYFTLVLSAYMFLCVFQKQFGEDYLRPAVPEGIKGLNGIRWKLRHSPAFYFHWILIPANAILIAGGSMASGVNYQDSGHSNKITTARALRCTGQAIFLLMTVILGSLAAKLYFKEHKRGALLLAVAIAWPFLLVRGIYGILAAVLPAFDYYNFKNYTSSGISESLVVGEYVMGTTMEVCAAGTFLVQALMTKYIPPSPPNSKLGA